MSILAALAVSTLLTVTVDGVATSSTVLPVNEAECSKKALDIMLKSPRRGPVVSADCTVLVAEEPAKPASAASAPKPKEKQE